MELEKQLQEIRDLQMGNVEKAVRETEDYRQDIQKLSKVNGNKMESYLSLFKEKLLKAINNINILGEIIGKIDDGGYHHSINETEPIIKLYLSMLHYEKVQPDSRTRLEKITMRRKERVDKFFNLSIEGERYVKIDFKFYSDTSSLDTIRLSRFKDNQLLISPRKSKEFVEAFLPILEEDIKGDDSIYKNILRILNEIPNAIVGIYNAKKKNQLELLERISLLEKETSSLEVSDF